MFFFYLNKVEWKLVGCYKNSVCVLVEILKVKSKLINSWYVVCMLEVDGKGIMLFGMDDNRCWIGENMDSIYSKYGILGLCKKMKKGLYYGLLEYDIMCVYMKDV